MKRILLSLALLSLTSLGFAQKQIDHASAPSLVKDAKEKGNVKFADSLAQDYINNYLFNLKEDQLMSKNNLVFISENLNTTDSKGFKLFFKQRNKINSILGADKAEYAIRYEIAKQFIPKAVGQNSTVVDWKSIEHTVTAKFGALGHETVCGKKMLYYFIAKDWSNFCKYYILYFKQALRRPEYDINNVSWALFENINDLKKLEFACGVMKYAIETWDENSSESHDTYANLLYKTGKKKEAIEWEEKALRLAKGNRYFEKQFTTVLEKMGRNEKTWPDTAVKL